jgi:Helix-turn-helix domain
VFEIGNSLREARVRQRLEHRDVELGTKIRARYIRALEEEEFATLPGDTYIRGFLRTYADYLGLDGQIYVDEYSSRYAADGRDERPPDRARRRRRDRGVERRAVLLALLGIAVLAALVIVAWKFGGASPPGSGPSVVQTRQQARTRPTALVLRGIGKGTFVEVRRRSRSGQIVLQGTVPPGGVEKLTGSRFYLYIRRPTRIRVTLGGSAVSLPAHRDLEVVVTPSRTIRLAG